jgi:hypothetical protein
LQINRQSRGNMSRSDDNENDIILVERRIILIGGSRHSTSPRTSVRGG